MNGWHVCSFTEYPDLRIEAAGKSYRFEFSKRFGPAMLDKRGEIKDGLPRQRDPFWLALQLWCKQEHRVENGRCVYDVPPPQRALRLSRRTLVMLAPDEDAAERLARAYADAGIEQPEGETPDVVVVDEFAALRSNTRHGQAADLGTDTSRNGVDGIERGHLKDRSI